MPTTMAISDCEASPAFLRQKCAEKMDSFGRQRSINLAFCVLCMIAAPLLMGGCCGHAPVVKQSGIESVFNGFVFVGDFALGGNLPSHGTCGCELPKRFVPGRRYVFHHEEPFVSTDFGNDVAPARLAGLGFSAGKLTGIVGFTSGGPMWLLKFSRGSCQGQIDHDIDQKLLQSRMPWNRKWEPADYVLTLSGTCE
jgi:hypothetical protein